MGSDDLVTVRQYLHSPEAYLACGALEAEGISAVILDEEVSQLYGAPLSGGVRLQVAQKDLDRARELLAALERSATQPES